MQTIIATHQKLIKEALLSLSVSVPGVTIDADPSMGDFSTNVALSAYKSLDKSRYETPRALAETVVAKIQAELPNEEITVAGPGFINFAFKPEFLMSQLANLASNPTHFLTQTKKSVLVEYSSPNIAKPFTVGHLRSTIIGEALANLFELKGYRVFRDNHLGDWGTQFGKLIYAIKTWGNLAEIEKAERPVKVLVTLYQKFHEEAEKDSALEDQGRAWFAKLEKGDHEAKEIWQKCIDWSWREFDAVYKELGCHPFTENGGKGYGESFFEDKMAPIIQELKDKHLLKTGKEGAQIVEFPNEEFPPLMILKKDGSTLYATRDLATDKFRREKYGSDILIINEVGAEQSQYFKQLYRLEELLGWYKPNQRVHVGHGFFRLKEGKMSTRKGTVIWLEDVLHEAVLRAQKLAGERSSQTVAHQVGIGALKWNDLKRSAHLDVVFDWDEVLSMEGNSGPYVQYAAVRCQSIGKKAAITEAQSATAYTPNGDEARLLRKLLKFSVNIDRCLTEYTPHYLCTYLFELAQEFNTFYNKHRVLDQGAATPFRLLLTQAVGKTLSTGLSALGIQTPEKM